MLLEQYVDIFKQNEITGTIVLDISLEDLDYMGITVLAHRKVLLKAIEDLRQNKRVTLDITAPQVSGTKGQSGIARTSSDPDMLKLRIDTDVRITSILFDMFLSLKLPHDSIANKNHHMSIPRALLRSPPTRTGGISSPPRPPPSGPCPTNCQTAVRRDQQRR